MEALASLRKAPKIKAITNNFIVIFKKKILFRNLLQNGRLKSPLPALLLSQERRYLKSKSQSMQKLQKFFN
ncbi:MAG: hypothetical protein A2149_07685 [Candidatus Schekmanbacteria bacterium RBG_16_38_11]|uniref:Uncharacterized protein n=1 Tax=Candidatus Schekmanbacteria bacterium RBG_16_38_11 TaxID=1817880 RepID=A0A1F7S1H4_9BACT|nr:MAG: hypothetical protein A2149_07685 [Candidatus Schekmanbacteria bacterium RBG_16_38_11]